MGGGVSVNSCVENFEKIESGEGNVLTDSQREHLKKMAEDILGDAETPLEVERNLGSFESSNMTDKRFLKYLAVEVMKLITRQAIEDAMRTLLSETEEDYDIGAASSSKEKETPPPEERRK